MKMDWTGSNMRRSEVPPDMKRGPLHMTPVEGAIEYRKSEQTARAKRKVKEIEKEHTAERKRYDMKKSKGVYK